MQKITKIYVGNYGVDMAWYDGIVFDLTAPDTGKPTDTIINLENGGGKTTLLSFIFSCFETSQERFLKHIQNKNHRLSQYFAKDGLPGVALLEWEMPSRVAGGDPYKLVVGQVVSVRSGADREDVDRVFFSFESNSALNFNSVPAPNLGYAPVTSMSDFMRWLHEAQKQVPGLFHTRTQQDWQKHLRDDCLIDVEMLQLQVSFSAQEGGMDAGFLTFNSEPEFVRKFLELTMDAKSSAAVRLAVVNTCDKLRRKPFFQRRLAELETLQTSLTNFDVLALDYRMEQEAQSEALRQGAGLAVALEAQEKKLQTEIEQQTQTAKDQDKAATENAATEKARAAEVTVLKLHELQRKAIATENQRIAAESAQGEAAKRLRLLRAAQAQSEVLTAIAHKNLLEAQVEKAAGDLVPWQREVERQGAILRRALFDEEQKLKQGIEAANEKVRVAGEVKKSAAAKQSALGQAESRCIEKRAKILADMQSGERAKKQLIDDQVLAPNETAEAAMNASRCW